MIEEKKMTYATKQSAGLDLRCKEPFEIRGGEYSLVNVGKVKIPAGYVGFIMPKSGLSVKHNIVARLGVIDADYTGDILVALDNRCSADYCFAGGDKVAQLVVVPCIQLPEYEVEQKERGDNGFGSTGK